jgi:hypothetical protein
LEMEATPSYEDNHACIKIAWHGSCSNKAYQNSVSLLPSSCQVWRSQVHLLPYWANACWCTYQTEW